MPKFLFVNIDVGLILGLSLLLYPVSLSNFLPLIKGLVDVRRPIILAIVHVQQALLRLLLVGSV